MTQLSVITGSFPKSVRLLKRADFRFPSFAVHKSSNFSFVFSPGDKAKVGISISKRVLRKAIARNRVRRLIREVFRSKIECLSGYSIHVIGRDGLSHKWKELRRANVEKEFEALMERLACRKFEH